MSEWLKLSILIWMMLIAIKHSSKVFFALFLKYIEDGDRTWAKGGGGGIVECCDYFSGLHLTIVVIANKTRALVFDALHSSNYFYHQFIKLSNYY